MRSPERRDACFLPAVDDPAGYEVIAAPRWYASIAGRGPCGSDAAFAECDMLGNGRTAANCGSSRCRADRTLVARYRAYGCCWPCAATTRRRSRSAACPCCVKVRTTSRWAASTCRRQRLHGPLVAWSVRRAVGAAADQRRRVGRNTWADPADNAQRAGDCAFGGTHDRAKPRSGLLIRRYIAQILSQPALRDHVAAVLEELITGYGTKRPMSEPDLAGATKLRPGEVRAVMNGLAAGGLARPLDGEQAVWELSHDFVARAVARQLGRRRRDVLRHSAAYAAPALLVLALVSGGLAVAWHTLSPYRCVHSELAELGLTVAPCDGRVQYRNQLKFFRGTLRLRQRRRWHA